jgi:protein TonB
MFEDALVESAHRIKTRSKYWSVVAVVINTGAVIALAVWPLLHPQALPTQAMASLLVAPAPPPPPPPVQPVVKLRTQPQSLAAEIQATNKIVHGTTTITNATDVQPGLDPMTLAQATGDGEDSMSSLMGQMQFSHAVVRAATQAHKPTVSSSFMAGLLVFKPAPQYPAIARETRTQGTVVLQATIGKTGQIENLRVLSGPPLLQRAALDAVRAWRYKPFYLNGEPVAVETTVNVVFSLGN